MSENQLKSTHIIHHSINLDEHYLLVQILVHPTFTSHQETVKYPSERRKVGKQETSVYRRACHKLFLGVSLSRSLMYNTSYFSAQTPTRFKRISPYKKSRPTYCCKMEIFPTYMCARDLKFIPRVDNFVLCLVWKFDRDRLSPSRLVGEKTFKISPYKMSEKCSFSFISDILGKILSNLTTVVETRSLALSFHWFAFSNQLLSRSVHWF
jgi:hypothetical protein